MPANNVSSDLVWECVNKHNSFQVKRKQAGGVTLSRDPLNLVNKHSRKYAGFVNNKAVGVKLAPSGKSLTVISKNGENSQKPAKALHRKSYKNGTPSRKVNRSAAMTAVHAAGRPDLRQEAVARASALKHGMRPTKPSPAAKPRGAKKAAMNKSESA